MARSGAGTPGTAGWDPERERPRPGHVRTQEGVSEPVLLAPADTEAAVVVLRCEIPAAGALVVLELGERGHDHAPPRPPEAEAEVDVVEGDGQALIEAADRIPRLPPDHHAGGRDRAAGAHRRPAEVEVGGHPVDADADALVLHPPVAEDQPGAHRADARASAPLQHRLQPPGVAHSGCPRLWD